MGLQVVEVSLALFFILTSHLTTGQSLPTGFPTLPPGITFPTLPPGITFPTLPPNFTFPTLPPDFTFPTLPPIFPIEEASVEVDGLGKIQGALT